MKLPRRKFLHLTAGAAALPTRVTESVGASLPPRALLSMLPRFLIPPPPVFRRLGKDVSPSSAASVGPVPDLSAFRFGPARQA
jgi:hypothetical protein